MEWWRWQHLTNVSPKARTECWGSGCTSASVYLCHSQGGGCNKRKNFEFINNFSELLGKPYTVGWWHPSRSGWTWLNCKFTLISYENLISLNLTISAVISSYLVSTNHWSVIELPTIYSVNNMMSLFPTLKGNVPSWPNASLLFSPG